MTFCRYYEELSCPNLNEVIKERLKKGDKLTMPYGKLMERLDTFLLLKNSKHIFSKNKKKTL